ncbi:MAG: hypothetical protein M1817_006543 [Caeruleum heppii]|nr:MAG: hypothetical protein M1817_006543 [Caeruleum heppii]
MSNVSSDLIWEIVRPNNAYLVKRKSGGGAQFSRDPLNVLNKHSRKYGGFLNEKAVGVLPAKDGGVTLTTKKSNTTNQPAKSVNQVTWGQQQPGRKTYKGIVEHTAKRNYRSDLRAETVARASAIRKSQRSKKETPEKKLRGVKAKKAAESEAK